MAAFLPRLFTRQAALKSARVVPSLSTRPYAQRVEHKQDEDDAMEGNEDDDVDMENYGDPEKISGIQLTPTDYEDILKDDYEDDDTVTLGHLQLQRQRETLHYLRLIEHEMPKLVAYRKPFIRPTPETPLVVRCISYGGEPHPATAKRAITVAVDDLPLEGEDAVHRFKLLAGPRWSPRPPADGGISNLDEWGNGYVKIACESFPDAEMNLRWASDVVNRLLKEANTPSSDKFRDVPLDLRHIFAKARKAKRGEHLRGRLYQRPTKHDFPQEWLPQLPEEPEEELEEDLEQDPSQPQNEDVKVREELLPKYLA